jgi:hypothetical protein
VPVVPHEVAHGRVAPVVHGPPSGDPLEDAPPADTDDDDDTDEDPDDACPSVPLELAAVAPPVPEVLEPPLPVMGWVPAEHAAATATEIEKRARCRRCFTRGRISPPRAHRQGTLEGGAGME